MLKRMMTGVLVMALVLGLAGIATAAPYDLDGSQTVNWTGDPAAPPDLELLDNGTPLSVSPDGEGVYIMPEAGRGLDLGANWLRTTRGSDDPRSDILLNLNGGDLVGTGAELPAGDYVYSRPDGNVSLSTFISPPSSANVGSGHIDIQNVRDISTAMITTGTDGRHWGTANLYSAGDITIGSEGNRARHIRVDSIDARVREKGRGGAITIYSSGNVLIQDASADPIPGEIRTGGENPGGTGDINISHHGNFVAGDIQSGSGRGPGNVSIDGNALGNDPTGTFRVANLYTYAREVSGWGGSGGTVEISGYTDVTITGNIHAYSNSTAGDHHGGDVIIGGSTGDPNVTGDITVKGNIDLSYRDDPANSGNLTLRTSGGSITLAELDLDLLQSAWLDAGSGASWVLGGLHGFDVDNPDDGLLEAPLGQHIYYDPFYYDEGNLVLGGNPFPNAYLLGTEYTLQSGGVLAPVPVPIPEPAGLSLLGLALLGLKRKRRS